jgi:hypothetical protein
MQTRDTNCNEYRLFDVEEAFRTSAAEFGTRLEVPWQLPADDMAQESEQFSGRFHMHFCLVTTQVKFSSIMSQGFTKLWNATPN